MNLTKSDLIRFLTPFVKNCLVAKKEVTTFWEEMEAKQGKRIKIQMAIGDQKDPERQDKWITWAGEHFGISCEVYPHELWRVTHIHTGRLILLTFTAKQARAEIETLENMMDWRGITPEALASEPQWKEVKEHISRKMLEYVR